LARLPDGRDIEQLRGQFTFTFSAALRARLWLAEALIWFGGLALLTQQLVLGVLLPVALGGIMCTGLLVPYGVLWGVPAAGYALALLTLLLMLGAAMLHDGIVRAAKVGSFPTS
jgi:hypothetical protein